jgi:hypothetical protein
MNIGEAFFNFKIYNTANNIFIVFTSEDIR